MSGLYLILHKVRGQPAFDVAEQLEGSGTPTDSGPWWIIGTSGHRAYPYYSIPLYSLVNVNEPENMRLLTTAWQKAYTREDSAHLIFLDLECPPMPPDHRDHYSVNDHKTPIQPVRQSRPAVAATTQDLEDLLS